MSRDAARLEHIESKYSTEQGASQAEHFEAQQILARLKGSRAANKPLLIRLDIDNETGRLSVSFADSALRNEHVVNTPAEAGKLIAEHAARFYKVEIE